MDLATCGLPLVAIYPAACSVVDVVAPHEGRLRRECRAQGKYHVLGVSVSAIRFAHDIVGTAAGGDGVRISM